MLNISTGNKDPYEIVRMYRHIWGLAFQICSEDPFLPRDGAAQVIKSGFEVIFFFFMLNSAEHETFSANKYENANNSWHFHIY